jgi:uncharacterized protein (DUF433 family)
MSNKVSSVISAFSEEQVERLTGISVARLRYWDRTDFFKPSLAAENRRVRLSRIYTFLDIASLRVIAVLIKQYSVPLAHLRQVVMKLGGMDNAGWTRITLYVLNRKVSFDDVEAGRQREIVSDQYLIGIPLERVLSDTKRDVASLSERGSELNGKVVRKMTVARNAPVVAGTRIPVRNIKQFHDAGYSPVQIMKEYPTLSKEDVLAAISFGEAA